MVLSISEPPWSPIQCLLRPQLQGVLSWALWCQILLAYQDSGVWPSIVLGGFIRKCLWALSQTNRGFSMAKTSKKSQQPITNTKPSTSSTKYKKAKIRREPKARTSRKVHVASCSRNSGKIRPAKVSYSFPGDFPSPSTPNLSWPDISPSSTHSPSPSVPFVYSIFLKTHMPCHCTLLSFQVQKTSKKDKKAPPRSTKRGASENTVIPTENTKKANENPLFGHYHRLMEEETSTETEPEQSYLGSSSTSTCDQESQ